jgi:hypothetical protein
MKRNHFLEKGLKALKIRINGCNYPAVKINKRVSASKTFWVFFDNSINDRMQDGKACGPLITSQLTGDPDL